MSCPRSHRRGDPASPAPGLVSATCPCAGCDSMSHMRHGIVRPDEARIGAFVARLGDVPEPVHIFMLGGSNYPGDTADRS